RGRCGPGAGDESAAGARPPWPTSQRRRGSTRPRARDVTRAFCSFPPGIRSIYSRSIVPSRLLVSGGLGFIGSEVIRRAAARGDDVVNVDACTYAGDPRRLAGLAEAVETIRADV